MPKGIKTNRAQGIADATRAGKKAAEKMRIVDDYGSRLRNLRNSPEYKAWVAGNRAMESSMSTDAFRGITKGGGRSSQT